MPAIVKLFLDTTTDQKVKIRGYSDVARIEQAVDIAPEQEAIWAFVTPAIAIGTDVSGFESRQRSLLCDSTATLIDIGYEYPKCSLSKAWLKKLGFAIALLLCFSHAQNRRAGKMIVDGFPEAKSIRVAGVIGFKLDDVG